MHKIFAVKEKNSQLVHCIISESMVEFFRTNFSIFNVVEISTIGFSQGSVMVDGKKVGINSLSCHEPLKIDTVGYMLRTWNTEHTYQEIAKCL